MWLQNAYQGLFERSCHLASHFTVKTLALDVDSFLSPVQGEKIRQNESRHKIKAR